ncbi:hypothetical protein J6590_046803 [Homalodisca vitripennis]|nr:hypothetical protein J6590_046803 [Homalodisca vitripennis]
MCDVFGRLDQLHNVGYRRDPGMQQDQQKRHHEQMHLFTQQSSGAYLRRPGHRNRPTLQNVVVLHRPRIIGVRLTTDQG